MTICSAVLVCILILTGIVGGGNNPDNLRLSFRIETSCTCSERDLILLTVLTENYEMILNKTIPAIQKTTCLVNLTNNGQVRFRWQSLQIDAQQTCCWTIMDPEIVVEKNNVIRKQKQFRTDVHLCFEGSIIDKQWICSIFFNSSFTSGVQSDLIGLDNFISDVAVDVKCLSFFFNYVALQCFEEVSTSVPLLPTTTSQMTISIRTLANMYTSLMVTESTSINLPVTSSSTHVTSSISVASSIPVLTSVHILSSTQTRLTSTLVSFSVTSLPSSVDVLISSSVPVSTKTPVSSSVPVSLSVPVSNSITPVSSSVPAVSTSITPVSTSSTPVSSSVLVSTSIIPVSSSVPVSTSITPVSSSVPVSTSITPVSTSSTPASSSVPVSTCITPVSSTTVTISSLLSTAVSTHNPRPVTSNILPSSLAVMCETDGQWMETLAGRNATNIGFCYRGTVDATRRCDLNGIWDKFYCLISPEFNSILNQIHESPEKGLNTLSDELTQQSLNSESSITQFVFLLNQVSTSDISMGKNFTKKFLDVSNDLIAMVKLKPDSELNPDIRRSIGSQLLLSLDNVALNIAEPSDETLAIGDNLFLRVSLIDEVPIVDITGIMMGNNSITLPVEIFNNAAIEPVRIGSFFFQNLSDLLPPRNNESTIISPIISTTTNCQLCSINQLVKNVTIQLQVKGISNVPDSVHCVFYEFDEQTDDSLPTGDWNTRGCSLLINGDTVSCSCNHLTHFAILLSPGIQQGGYGDVHYTILNTIGLILVPISLLCMLIIILTYSLTRSLWSIRNYIHIMLCVSLSMAQFVFIVGIDKINDKGLCSAIAVILQYLFLVSFMWMLMEGVVLYVTLVKVFIYNHKWYIFGFTAVSYVVPAVYMALIVPLGFLVGVNDIPSDSHYLYSDNDTLVACWLNYDSGFVWSYIAPVILIILVNIVFFIMAVVIMRAHSKKQQSNHQNDQFNAKNWLKVCVFLTLVMGITWIAALLVFRKEMLFVAYIMTVFIAGQGILLFIVLVPLSKNVRDTYLSHWKHLKTRSELLTRITSVSSTTTFINNSSSNKGERPDSSFIMSSRSTDTGGTAQVELNGELSSIVNPSYDQVGLVKFAELPRQDINEGNEYETPTCVYSNDQLAKIIESNYETDSKLHGESNHLAIEHNTIYETIECDSAPVKLYNTSEHQYDTSEHQYETSEHQYETSEHQYETLDQYKTNSHVDQK